MAKTKWIVDPTHSSIDFTIRHMMIAKVKGTFHTFEANIEADPTDLTTADVQFSIDLSSIDTRNDDRDAHLRTADFFDIEKYPKLTFQSTQITKTGDGEYNVTGNLNLHGVTRPETFSVTFEGQGKDPWGNEKAGFSGQGSLKRSDYGLTWNAALETGGVLVGDEVKVSIEIEASKQA
ncbi:MULTISPECIES: YceI family protein [Paenibacillus]|uniref:YceI-like domain-containing protein n=1 Tax=Paenibacillus naphthalenovorans TaxID=162209 RepID=A0A0U2VMZ4_9BACL|nr:MULTISPECIES: YceI family protein [Paenibacillus]ALS24675.1 YceI-like domain-containing protein [Paenibacillus naphthalenovorans]NTZ19569.1 polyisoprenoid-binding protein [Paenibacillus sp. JMULE4]GCL73996.1 polyisoprenoid-binding protein [Paenibacillus naphthalenovorans]SDJ68670.1 Polyisoprenoid-binding protein YceI [Paenibacillus naphthalenovorans]